MKRLIGVVFALAILAVPSVGLAKGPNPSNGKKCLPHTVAYEVWGKLDSGSLTKNANGTYSGTLTVDVKRANRYAKSAKGTTVTYTLTNTRLKLHGEDPAALVANSRVKLKGTITKLAKKCDQTGFTPTITIKHGKIKPPKH